MVLSSGSALSAFHKLLVRVAQGRVPESVAAALALSKLTPLREPGGGARPIATPSSLRRLAGKALVSTRKGELAETLGRHRFAIGTAAGAELLALTEADPDLVLMALDATSAFCTIRRPSSSVAASPGITTGIARGAATA